MASGRSIGGFGGWFCIWRLIDLGRRVGCLIVGSASFVFGLGSVPGGAAERGVRLIERTHKGPCGAFNQGRVPRACARAAYSIGKGLVSGWRIGAGSLRGQWHCVGYR